MSGRVKASKAGMQRSRAQPPPGTMPSSTAARVAFRASVTLSFFSFTSTSLVPPTCQHSKPHVKGCGRSPAGTALLPPGLAPLLILSKPSLAMARARTVAVVVPSPASSLVIN
ncbi:hypothetical protein EK904_002445 [Melospiza melodia maxima]|nr:hypothetical protein EK904_002445 [Melospiza melodia maxima]